MEISIETLAGTSFDLRVSPFETVISVKQKIQRLEGLLLSPSCSEGAYVNIPCLIKFYIFTLKSDI